MTIEVNSISALIAAIKRDTKAREREILQAGRRAARRGVSHVKRNIPVAHGELRESVHADGHVIVVDAPHAAAVNYGSRPHTPPLAPLIEWVKLRGTQGLLSDRQIDRLPGTTTAGAARSVRSMLRAHEQGGASSVDSPVRVARAIQQAIAKHGTKPHHFIEKALPDIYAIYGDELRKAINTKS